MNTIYANRMWTDRSDVYPKQSWGELNDAIILSEPEYSACASPGLQTNFDFVSTGQGSEMFGSYRPLQSPQPSHLQIPSMTNSPTLNSSPELSPGPVPGYSPLYTAVPPHSNFEEIKIEPQKHNSRSTSRRRHQNRAAQRAFRERREQHVKELEARVHSTEENYRELQSSYERLEGIHTTAKQTIERQTIELDVFRTIVKCGYRLCECTEDGDAEPCVIKSALKERSESGGCSRMKKECANL